VKLNIPDEMKSHLASLLEIEEYKLPFYFKLRRLDLKDFLYKNKLTPYHLGLMLRWLNTKFFSIAKQRNP